MANVMKKKCLYCGKLAKEVSRDLLDNEVWINLECGHVYIHDALATDDSINIVSSDGRELFPFQKKTVEFMEAADCNGMILHEQALGKTVCAAALIRRNSKSLFPLLYVCKSGLRAQVFAELFRWTGEVAQVITSSKEIPYFDVFNIIIISIDTLRLVRPDIKAVSEWDIAKAEANGRKLSKEQKIPWTDDICAKFKCVIIDESQKIKNPGSSRTQALRKIVSLANNGNKPRVIPMSGTNIEKHAGEFFVTLNLCRPELFPQQSTFQLNHCEINPETGKIMGLRDPKRFKELTKDFIIRYTRAEVMPDLPKVFRQFRLAELEGDELKAYIAVVKEFQEAMDDPEVPMLPTDILGYLSRMRHITGIAKVNAAVEFVEEFLLESERKLVIFLHHKMAAAALLKKLGKLCEEGAFNPPLYLPGGLKLGEGSSIIEEFRKPGNRILVASELAAGEGFNMQFCQDCLFMERQWNPSAEEQCEGRFPRPRPEDPWPADARINAHYLIAAGTMDDFLTDIIEVKRRNVSQTLDGKEIEWDEKSIQMELAKILQVKGLRKWKLS